MHPYHVRQTKSPFGLKLWGVFRRSQDGKLSRKPLILGRRLERVIDRLAEKLASGDWQ